MPSQQIVVAKSIQCQRLKEIRARCLQLVQIRQEVDQEQKHLKLVSPFSLQCWYSFTLLHVMTKHGNNRSLTCVLRQPAETTVNDHIRLLGQYNKTKDVGQQLIGLIAENRGVPIGSLYSDQEYGVGPDD